MTPEKLFTQAGRVFNFTLSGKRISCNYYFTRVNNNSPNPKLWMNILLHVGERKDVYELTIEQPESSLTIKPRSTLDERVQRLAEVYLINLAS